MVVETVTFRLAAGVEDAEYVAADARAQTEAVYAQPGLVRRTTARGADGRWLVITLWRDDAAADAAHAALADAPAMSALRALADGATIERGRYTTLD